MDKKIVSLFVVIVCLIPSTNFQNRNESNCKEIQAVPKESWEADPPDGYLEENFTLIEIDERDIILPENITLSEQNSPILAYTNISYNTLNENDLYHFRLPDNYDDATNFIIQRSATEVYHCFYDNNNVGRLFTGTDTYWEVPTNSETKDVLLFEISPPPIVVYEDKSVKYYDDQVNHYIEISRFSNLQRVYQNGRIEVILGFPFVQDFEISIFDETGGVQYRENITDTCNLNVSTISKAGSSFMKLTFDVGLINTFIDYTFKIEFQRLKFEPSRWDNWVFSIVMPIVGGLTTGYLGTSAMAKAIAGNNNNSTIKKFRPYSLVLWTAIWFGFSFIWG